MIGVNLILILESPLPSMCLRVTYFHLLGLFLTQFSAFIPFVGLCLYKYRHNFSSVLSPMCPVNGCLKIQNNTCNCAILLMNKGATYLQVSFRCCTVLTKVLFLIELSCKFFCMATRIYHLK